MMLKPRRHWTDVSDDHLIDLDLEIDNPNTLNGLVTEVPANFRDAHVEFKYDLRGHEVAEFSCVHGHHKHKAGFVMNLGSTRFMVGHICAKSIYNEDFEQYTADFDAAVIRRDTLRRVREIRNAVVPFRTWLVDLGSSDAIKAYHRLGKQLDTYMPWIYDHLPALARMDPRVTGAALPKTLCSVRDEPRRAYEAIMADLDKVISLLGGDAEKVAAVIGLVRSKLDGIAQRAEKLIEQLREVETFFHPAVLAAICKFANEQDNPGRRTYSFGLLSISCRNDKGHKTPILVPKNFAAPKTDVLKAFRAVLSGASMTTPEAQLKVFSL